MRHLSRAVSLCLLVAAMAACTPRSAPNPRAPVVDRTQPPGVTQPAPPGVTQPAPPPSAEGIVTYDGYQAAVAAPGDTVASVAARIGLSASALAAYNGLEPGHALRPGDELALPPRQGGYGASGVSLAAPVPAEGPLPGAPAAPALETRPLSAGAAATAPAETTGWSPGIAAAAIDRATGINDDGTLAAPPSAASALPPEPRPERPLSSPDLGQYQTGASERPTPPPRPAAAPVNTEPTEPTRVAAAAGGLRLIRPVRGPIAVGFNQGSGPARNDGVDFAAAAGAPVIAAADGTVALVSKSLGGLGTIVLVRHQSDYLTVYGRVDGVSVTKGDVVRSGQQIGSVSNAAAPAEPRLHFEVRRGAESLDPMQFL